MKDQKITDLTVSQLQQIIRETVQEAVAEVLIEFNALAQAEEDIRLEAELAEYLRNNMQGQSYNGLFNTPQADD
jgi:L-aminopeptidase/D-esterase-like protein